MFDPYPFSDSFLKQMAFYLRSTSQVWYVEFDQTPRLNPRDSTLRETIRISLQLIDKLPYGIDCNVEIWGIQLKQLGIFFLPDALFLETETHCRHVLFQSINMQYSDRHYNQPDSVPSDAPVLGKTWLHMTVKGKPDMRYKHNPEVTIVRYGIIQYPRQLGRTGRRLARVNPSKARHGAHEFRE